ncbi:putative ATP-grasp-modified RiPP [Streptomyces sp. NPDC006186]|uniref:putative ATP-grasp-modified RiPP n=1 Tax=Streptomyces sp. NPDC006186 TaxID=3155248 RepID=UPI0033B0870D
MGTGTIQAPWAWRLITDRLPVGAAPYAEVTLDPATQTARYTNASGEVVEMGKHGTSRTTGTASVSGGGWRTASAAVPGRCDDRLRIGLSHDRCRTGRHSFGRRHRRLGHRRPQPTSCTRRSRRPG